MELLAPEFKEIHDYMYKLASFCISKYHKEFALCLYKGEKISLNTKKDILAEMFDETKPVKSQTARLDNYLNMYTICLQEISEDLVKKGKLLNDSGYEQKIKLLYEKLQINPSGNKFGAKICQYCSTP